jgi:hypothetical protein
VDLWPWRRTEATAVSPEAHSTLIAGVLDAVRPSLTARLNPGGTCWLVAQRYVPVGAMCAEAEVEGAWCAALDDRFAVWRIDQDGGAGGAGAAGPGGGGGGGGGSRGEGNTEEGREGKSKKQKKDKKDKKDK